MKFIQPEWPAPSSIHAYTTTIHSNWQELKLPEEPIWLTQIHSSIVVEAVAENREKNADGLFTNQSHRVCAVVTADCLPVLFCNRQGTHVAAIHAGWRGLANGIIETALQALNLPPEELLVWLGPAIGPQKFEVGKDVYDAFTLKHALSSIAFTPYRENKWLADLYALAKIRLALHGIHHVYGGNYCTYTQDDLFFSYRRDKGKTGRLVSLIWRNS